ncbi:serine/threonine-protein kinase haspin [Gastrophryne carolinensis]
MAGKRSGSQGGVIRTYGRRQPVRRLQAQKWLSPGDRKHLFSSSSSSSSSHLSSACDDSDFVAPERKKRRRSPVKKVKKRKKKCPAKKRPESQSPSTLTNDKENGPPPKRRSISTPVFATPFKKHVTFRRKARAPPPSVAMRTLSGRPKRDVLSPVLSDSLCDFVERKRRKLRVDVPCVLDSSVNALPSPLQRTPLLHSTPSVRLTSVPRTNNSFVRQLALCEPLEESICAGTRANEGPKDEAPSNGDVRKLVHSGTGIPDHGKRTPPRCLIGHDSDSTYQTSIVQASSNGVKCLSIKISQGASPFCVLSPVLVSSSESQSVICLGEQPGRRGPEGGDGGLFCVSSELFSGEDLPIDDHRDGATGSPCDKWKPFRRKSFQPVVRLDSEAVGEYLRGKILWEAKDLLAGEKSSAPGAIGEAGSDAENLPADEKSSAPGAIGEALSDAEDPPAGKKSSAPGAIGEAGSDDEGLPAGEKSSAPRAICEAGSDAEDPTAGEKSSAPRAIDGPEDDPRLSRMRPAVMLDREAVVKYFEDKASELLERTMPATTCPFPASQAGLRTPLVASSVLSGRIPGSVTSQGTTATGRKVCISGFSAKRWGNPRKKPASTPQQLSFQDYSNTSLLLFKEGVSACGAPSPSLLFSSSMLSSSFLNSSAVKDLNLSSELLSLRDPQREHQRWARLRAALSLHRKKKVEAGFPSRRPAEAPNRNKSLAANHSSLLLLSPFQSSLCCDDLTDAEKVLAECQQEKPVTFYQCLSQKQLRQCQKVGEGVYGEVFRTLRGDQHVALKVIPIEGSQKVNGESQKSFAEILPEIIISKELSLLSGGETNVTSGFIKLHSSLIGGQQGSRQGDLLFLPSVSVSRSILHQVTAALAVAEEELRFEHRDLHWGNLLIEKCSARTLSASLRGDALLIPSAGVQVKIIDYTLSRLDKDGLTVFCDLSTDEELFLGEGDLQFDVYRGMRQENQNVWSLYRPHSNVLWLHYLCDKLLSEVHYVRKPTSAAYQKELRKLRDFRRDVRQFSSASEVLRKSKLFN